MAGLSKKATKSSKKASEQDDAAADLALIAAAQKVEHYEISGVRHGPDDGRSDWPAGSRELLNNRWRKRKSPTT